MNNIELFVASAAVAFAGLYTLENVFNVPITFHSHKKSSKKKSSKKGGPVSPCLSGDVNCTKRSGPKGDPMSKGLTQSVPALNPAFNKKATVKKTSSAPHPLSHLVPGLGTTTTSRTKAKTLSHSTAAAQKTNTLPARRSLSPIINDVKACGDGTDQSACDRIAVIQDGLNRKRKKDGSLPNEKAVGIAGCEGLSLADCQTLVTAGS